MKLRKSLRFFNPPDDAGGGSGDAGPALQPLGDKFAEALKSARTPEENYVPEDKGDEAKGGEKAGAKAGEDDAKGDEAKGDKSGDKAGDKGAGEEAKSVLDAMLDGDGKADDKGGDSPKPDEADFEKEFPEVLPKEGRKEHWIKARQGIKERNAKISTLTREIGDLKTTLEKSSTASPESEQRIKDLESRLEEYQRSMVALNVEFDPEHRKKFVEGRKGLVTKAASKANAFGADGKEIEKAMALPDGRERSLILKEALADLDDYDRSRVMQLIGSVDALDDEKAELMKDPEGAWTALQATEKKTKAEAEARTMEQRNTVFNSVSKKMADQSFLYRQFDDSFTGAAEHNAEIGKMVEAAKKLIEPGANGADIVTAALLAQAAPRLEQLLVASRKEARDLRKILSKFDGAEPGFRNGKGPTKTPTEARLDRSPGDIFKESLAKSKGGDD